MRVSVSQAKAQLTDLVRRAERGEEIELTRRGQTVARLVQPPSRPKPTPEEKMRIIDEVMAASKPLPGPSAARAADFLYDDETGLPA